MWGCRERDREREKERARGRVKKGRREDGNKTERKSE